MLPFGLTQPKEQPRLLQQLSYFYLLPFPRKKLIDLRPWTHHVLYNKEAEKSLHIVLSMMQEGLIILYLIRWWNLVEAKWAVLKLCYFMIRHMDGSYVMLLMKQQFFMSHWYTVLQEPEKLWPMLDWSTVEHVMILQKYKGKQFVCGYNIVTKGVFVIQLSGNSGISVWWSTCMWVTRNCHFMINILYYA